MSIELLRVDLEMKWMKDLLMSAFGQLLIIVGTMSGSLFAQEIQPAPDTAEMGFRNWRAVVQMPYVNGEILIKLAQGFDLPDRNDQARRRISQLFLESLVSGGIAEPKVNVVDLFPSLARETGRDFLLIRVRDSSGRVAAPKLVGILKDHRHIERVSPNYILRQERDIRHGASGKNVLRWLDRTPRPRTEQPSLIRLLRTSDDPRHVIAALDGPAVTSDKKTTRVPNPTAPNPETQYLSGDFTDTDGDGMTDVAEIKYGFDKNDPTSFPAEPAFVPPTPIAGSGIGAVLDLGVSFINIRWNNRADSTFSLTLKDGTRILYRGGHYAEYAPVNYSKFRLDGTETLTGSFTEYDLDGHFLRQFPEFHLDLSGISMRLGDPSHRISFTFDGFPSDREREYREFLKRVIPIMRGQLGAPAEQFNCVIQNMGSNSDFFMVTDGGRTFLSDTSFIPRLIVHEIAHAWKGLYTFTSDEYWEYTPELSGFEEGSAEGMAFEIIHEYVRSYPTDMATLQLLRWRPYQYWSSRTTYYDFIRRNRATGAGDFWVDNSIVTSRYSIAATTFQLMRKVNPDCYKEIMGLYFEEIRDDPRWRPNRVDLVRIFSSVVPTVNGIALGDLLDALPVYRGRALEEGMYVLTTLRPYGLSGDQQFATSYVINDGRLWWGIRDTELASYGLPYWIEHYPGDDGFAYVDTQNEPFRVTVFDTSDAVVTTIDDRTRIDRDADCSPTGFGWKMIDDLDMREFSFGLYRETVEFRNFVIHDPNARDVRYFVGYGGYTQDRNEEYVIMIAIDGLREGEATITVGGEMQTLAINNGVAIFRSNTLPFDHEGDVTVRLANANGASHAYQRTLLEAGTYHGYFQHQFLIVDRNFDGIEDEFE